MDNTFDRYIHFVTSKLSYNNSKIILDLISKCTVIMKVSSDEDITLMIEDIYETENFGLRFRSLSPDTKVLAYSNQRMTKIKQSYEISLIYDKSSLAVLRRYLSDECRQILKDIRDPKKMDHPDYLCDAFIQIVTDWELRN